MTTPASKPAPKARRSKKPATKTRIKGEKKSTATADPRTRILLAALPNVAFDGWTEDVLARAVKKSGATAAAAQAAFPRGVSDLVFYFSDWADAEMEKSLTPARLKDLRVRDKIALGVRTRLEILAPHKLAVTAALRHASLSPRSPLVIRQVWRTADKIWWAAGDRATDYNHYTKRLLLAGVLSATTLFWLTDDSEAHERTWGFLDQRIDNVLKAGKFLSGIGRRAA